MVKPPWKKVLVGLAILALAIIYKTQATAPPVPKTLKERVEMASHIIVGTAKNIKIITRTNNIYKTVIPVPSHTGLETMAEFEIEVQEVIYPKSFIAHGPIKYRFGGGAFFSVDGMKRDLVGKTNIFILTQYQDIDGTCYGPSYGWYICESQELRKTELMPLIRAREAKDSKDKTQGTK